MFSNQAEKSNRYGREVNYLLMLKNYQENQKNENDKIMHISLVAVLETSHPISNLQSEKVRVMVACKKDKLSRQGRKQARAFL